VHEESCEDKDEKRNRYGIKQHIVAENTAYVYQMKVETREMTKIDKLVI
jgi:hypothetical protein